MSSKPTIESFLNKGVIYDRSGQMIFTRSSKEGQQLIANVGEVLSIRGWGAIQHLFEDQSEAGRFQDELGEWIADAINQKLKTNE